MTIQSDLRGRRLAHYLWGELEKIAIAATTATPAPSSDAGGTTSASAGGQYGTLATDADGDSDGSPAAEVVAANIKQLSKREARGTPPVQPPPPGYVFAPEVQAFIPDPRNPGWVRAAEAVEALKAKAFYEQGQQDTAQAPPAGQEAPRAEAPQQRGVVVRVGKP